MSKARSKGTRLETELLPSLRATFGDQVERAPLKGYRDNGDYVGVPIQFEAKNQAVPRFFDWARKATAKSWPWVCYYRPDRRLKDSPGELIMVPAEFGLQLLKVYYASFDWKSTPREL